ncbi:GtrA family protein [Candidatus Enterovibrio escicola]|uniref:GtrA family protein n=2 Tax=Candidatus Enterovibrio escicola TaxID=1927127 RepID=UPI001237C9A7
MIMSTPALKIFFTLPEKIRFILVGGFNTIFGFVVFTLLCLLADDYSNYLIILVSSNLIAVVVAFLMLKFLVFQTKGNYLKEFMRCYLTYLVMLGINVLLLYLMVDVLAQDIVISQFVITVLIVIFSYLGHKYFSFN